MTSLYEPAGAAARGHGRGRRIAVVSAHTSPLAALGGRETGGMNVYVRELSRELGARGYTVDVFTRRASEEAPETQPFGPNARVVNIPAGPAATIDKQEIAAHLLEFERELLDFVRREGGTYDLVHSHYWMSGVVASRLADRWSVPHVAMFHTLGEVKNRARNGEHEPASRIAAERAVATGADRIVVASEHERQSLATLYGAPAERIAVVPCGVDLDLFAPMDKEFARRRLGLKSTERIILFVGRIEPLKGIDILIDAAAQLHEDENFAVLIVGGDARAREQIEALRSQAAALGVDHHISFVGAVEHHELPLYYNAADVCVVPSHYESFGLVAVESMACGTPVVASRVGGLTTTISDGETGYLIPWRCAEPFAERLELLLDNDELRASFGRAGREAVERFRWSHVTDAVASLYDDVLAAAN
ncbi:MAG: glycosyltransferase family 1 protein [Dehalococcoidia bacterium]|nr:MAG: glycosyltransferase family 1 protein [Dehalococcoidia bacterium]